MVAIVRKLLLIFLVINYGNIKGCSAECCGCYETDCQDYMDMGHTTSGVYHVTPHGMRFGYDVYCDMETDNGGWLVFQRRLDGSEDFYRDWYDYERGFGNVSHEYWLGFLPLRRILGQGHYELRIDLEDWEGETRYARYNLFSISDSDDRYRLKVLSYTGNAGDALSNHNGQMFTTKDNDNDVAEHNCAESHYGAWWYTKCMTSNLNGKYYYENGTVHSNGVAWKRWTRNGQKTAYTLKKSEMKIRKV